MMSHRGVMVPVAGWCLVLAAGLARADTVDTDMTKGGVTFTSGNNSLHIGARVQIRYTGTDAGSLDADASGTTGFGREDGYSQKFEAKRVRLLMNGGMFEPWLSYKLQFEFASTSGSGDNKVKDALLLIRKAPAAEVAAGQFKVPFGLQELVSSGKQEFVDRAITIAKFVPGRDQGVTVGGVTREGKLGYAAGAFNGGGEAKGQDDQALMAVARVWLDPKGTYRLSESPLENPPVSIFHVGLSARTGEAMNGTATAGVFEKPDNETAYGLELGWKLRRWFASGEYFYMRDERSNPVSGPDVSSTGWHAQAGYMVIPGKAEVGLRLAFIDPDVDLSRDAVREARGVFGYAFHGHNLKLQADVGRLDYGAAYVDGSLPAIAQRGLPALGNRLKKTGSLTDAEIRVQLQADF